MNASILRHVSFTSNKIDRRHTYYLMLDTETVIPSEWCAEDEERDLSKSVPYDYGMSVVNKRGEVFAHASIIDGSIFFDRLDLMETCYFADKRTSYLDDLMNGTRTIAENAWEVREVIIGLCEMYNIKAIVAHNARFDNTACKNAMKFVGAEKPFMFPYGVDIWDTLAMSRSIYGKNKTYQKWCADNGYKTARNQTRYTAEIIYRFIINDNDFEESHTALEDVMIEKEIFAACFRAHKKMKKHYWKEDKEG